MQIETTSEERERVRMLLVESGLRRAPVSDAEVDAYLAYQREYELWYERAKLAYAQHFSLARMWHEHSKPLDTRARL